MKNHEVKTMGDAKFVEACKLAQEKINGNSAYQPVKPTRRQYKKWINHQGTAYQFGKENQ